MYDRTGKIVSTLKYTYAADGTLTGRRANGETVTYEHDAKGQLIGVTNGREDIERYIYDPAGNILSKTVRGLTTTFTYDRANQLAAMESEGKTTAFTYDGAGRMIQEGDRQYNYGWLDKVTEITEKGESMGSYTYGMDNQLATSTWKDREESYLWDGLALINRSGVDIINDPAITGGNPIVVGDEAVFSDQLGTSLGYLDGDKYTPTNVSSFGQPDKPDQLSFYTGKPYVEGIGYNFLYRNYRADLGKWQTSDPMGYPDGWNNLAYCNNSSLANVDNVGCASKPIDANPVTAHEYTVDDGMGGNIIYEMKLGGTMTSSHDYDDLKFTDSPRIKKLGAISIPSEKDENHEHGGLKQIIIDNIYVYDKGSDKVTEHEDGNGNKYKTLERTIGVEYNIIYEYFDGFKASAPESTKKISLNFVDTVYKNKQE